METPSWLKGCAVCKAGLCARFGELIESGNSQRQAASLLEKEQKEKLYGEVLYPAETLRTIYNRNRPPKKVVSNETTKQGEEWPMCSQCEKGSVNPKGNGICSMCRKINKQEKEKKKIQKAKEEFEQIPIDQEADRRCKEFAEKISQITDEFVNHEIGKISRETLTTLGNASSYMNTIYNEILKETTFIPS